MVSQYTISQYPFVLRDPYKRTLNFSKAAGQFCHENSIDYSGNSKIYMFETRAELKHFKRIVIEQSIGKHNIKKFPYFVETNFCCCPRNMYPLNWFLENLKDSDWKWSFDTGYYQMFFKSERDAAKFKISL